VSLALYKHTVPYYYLNQQYGGTDRREEETMTQHTEPGVGQSIDVLGIPTNYLEAGEGPPLVLIHGSGPGVSAHANWAGVMPELSKSFRVIALDCPGFGFSGRKPDAQYSMPFWIEHFLAFLDALGLKQVALVGNSFGGSLSLAVAATAPERITKLVLMGTPCGKFQITAGLRAARTYVPSHENLKAMLQMFPFDKSMVDDAMVARRLEASSAPDALTAYRALVPASAVEEGSDGIISGVPEKVVARLQQPILVLHGREDQVVPMELGLRIFTNAPNAQFHGFASCGHWVQVERRDQFVKTALAFLEDGSAP
jgi:2-hydroxy-6-oxo-octa-2,4-dienoate hydrolase